MKLKADNHDLDKLDKIIADESTHQAHLVSLIKHPSLLKQTWEPTKVMDEGKIPESVSTRIWIFERDTDVLYSCCHWNY